jgi:hypothetical protein
VEIGDQSQPGQPTPDGGRSAALNEVIDLHSTHLAMAKRHLPLPLMAALMGTAAIGVGLLGFGNGPVNRRFSLCSTLFTGWFLRLLCG